MPTYRNITLSLRSSAAETAPLFEYPPPVDSRVQLEDAGQRSAAVYVPATPKLTFWIAYHIKRPIPAGVQYFVFKLYMEGRLVVTWGAGEEDGWKGKAMFGLFENKEWRSGLEKRAFAFGDLREQGEGVDRETDHRTRFLEVRVFRAMARRRIAKEVMRLEDTEVGREGAGNVELVNAGTPQRDDPRRFYEYALRDALAEPFAVFKYYYRTESQLKALGVLPNKRVDEKHEEEPVTETGNGFEQLNFNFLPSAEAPTRPEERRPDSRTSIRMVHDSTAETGCTDEEHDDDEIDAASIRVKRLSFPPATRLHAPQEQSSGSPTKRPMSRGNASPAPTVGEYCHGTGSVEGADEVESKEDVGARKASGGFFKDTIRRVVGRHKRVRSS